MVNTLQNRTLLQSPLFWILLYLSLHFSIRIFFSQTLQVDDAEQIRHAQELLLGYPIPQPPLYSWLSWGLFKLFDTGLLALSILKYSLIALTFWLTWLVSGHLFNHTQTRWLATFSYLLMPSFAWHMHQGFTHTILLGFAIILTLHALLQFHRQSSNLNALYLGSAIGIGLMAKYSFPLFILLLSLSALSIHSYRMQLLSHQGLILLIPLLLITLPHLSWLVTHQQEVFGAIDDKLKVTHDNFLLERFGSLLQFSLAAIAFVTPLVLLYLGIAAKRFIPIVQTKHTDSRQLLNRFYLLLIVITILLALFISMPHFKMRWFHPLMMIFPLWMLSWIERDAALSTVQIRWIVGFTLFITLLILAVRLVQVTIGPELGKYSRLNRPIIESLRQIPQHHIEGSIFITNDHFLVSHLLAHYPGQPIVFGKQRFHAKRLHENRQCLYLWDDDTPLPPPKLPVNSKQDSIQTVVGSVTYSIFYAVAVDYTPSLTLPLQGGGGESYCQGLIQN